MPQSRSIEPFLEDLESRIVQAVEDDLLARWKRFCELCWDEPLFCPARPAKNPPRIVWPPVRINQALDDFDCMAFHQFAACSNELATASGLLLMVRANYGTPIMAMPFGVRLFVMPDETNTLPTCHPIDGGADGIRAILDREPPSLDHPYLQKVFEMGRRFTRIAQTYPAIGRHVMIYHPDLQGPLDIMEMLWGSEVFLAFVDEPDLVHRMLERITDLYIRVLRQWNAIVPPWNDGFAPHWGFLHRGRIMLRNDSAMNLSSELYKEFSSPYDQRLLDEFGGGAMHSCGRVEHFVPLATRLRGLHAFNLSQPHLNNMDNVWPHTIDRGVVLLDLKRDAAHTAINAGRDLRGRAHCG